MLKIKLLTSDGGFVANVMIPPFQVLPDSIMWGQRFFFKNTKDRRLSLEEQFTYREGFCVAAVITLEDDEVETTEEESIEVKEPAGDDKLLFGLPKDLDEAVETFLGFYGNAKDIDTIIDMTESQFVANAHHVSGTFIRNNWYLWWYEGHNNEGWPKSKPPIIQFFNDLGITHADDISSIIINSAYRSVHRKPIDIEQQVETYKRHWRKEGYKDGIFRPRK